VLVGAEDVDGADVGLDVMVGIVEDSGDIVGEGAVGEAGDVDGEDGEGGVGRFDIMKVGGLDMIHDGGLVIVHDGGFDIIMFVGTGASVFADVGDADGESEPDGATGGQPGQLGAEVRIGMRVGIFDNGDGRVAGATVGTSKLIDMEFTDSQKPRSSAPRLLT
jgi:hypothetical protein